MTWDNKLAWQEQLQREWVNEIEARKVVNIERKEVRWETDVDWAKGTDSNTETSGTGTDAVIQLTALADNDDDVPYTTESNYTLSDSDELEVASGEARLKEQFPPDNSFWAKYDTNINAELALGSPTGTAYGGASVSGGKLDLIYNDIRYVTYARTGNANQTTTGCVRFKVTPNYSGSPSGDKVFFCITRSPYISAKNLLAIRHLAATGWIQIMIASSSAAWIVLKNVVLWSPTSGQEYDFELNWDVTSGATRFFIDGVQQGSTYTETGTRTLDDIDTIVVGSDWNTTKTSNFKIDNLMFFDTVQHTANFTPSYPVFYPTTDGLFIDTKDASQISPTNVVEYLTATITNNVPANTDAKIMLSNDGRTSWLTWNGSAWTNPTDATDRTEGTSLSNIQSNITSLPKGNETLDVRLFLYTSDSNVYPSIQNINVTSTAGYETSGTFTSNSYDSTYPNLDWKKITYDATIPDGVTLTFKVRTSWDGTDWGDWSSAYSNGDEITESGRYIQWKVDLTGNGKTTPEINVTSIFYASPVSTTVNP